MQRSVDEKEFARYSNQGSSIKRIPLSYLETPMYSTRSSSGNKRSQPQFGSESRRKNQLGHSRSKRGADTRELQRSFQELKEMHIEQGQWLRMLVGQNMQSTYGFMGGMPFNPMMPPPGPWGLPPRLPPHYGQSPGMMGYAQYQNFMTQSSPSRKSDSMQGMPADESLDAQSFPMRPNVPGRFYPPQHMYGYPGQGYP